jgi:Carboxypeptidase regulatory-like domain
VGLRSGSLQEVPLEAAASVRTGFDLTRIARLLLGLTRAKQSSTGLRSSRSNPALPPARLRAAAVAAFQVGCADRNPAGAPPPAAVLSGIPADRRRAATRPVSRRWLAAAAVLILVAAPAAAQAPPAGRLLVTVIDPSGAVIPNAAVTIAGEDAATRGAGPRPAVTSAAGVATMADLPAGRYTIEASFPGFETVTVHGIRVRSGDTRRTVTLPIRKVAEDVTVGRDKRSSALDPRGDAFSTVLTREQIDALPDDPDEMAKVLQAMAPPGSTIRVDGFTGGKLPPKSQIRSIRLPNMDMMAAENHGGLTGALFIDVMTQPGSGPLRGTVDFTFRDAALDARNPFTPVKPDAGLRQGGASASGTVVPGRSSFSVSAQRASQFDSGSILAALPGSTLAGPVRRPSDRLAVNALFDQALPAGHMLRASFGRTSASHQNLGVGGYDLPDRAYATSGADGQVRLSENGPVGRRFFLDSRLQVHWSDTTAVSAVEAPAIEVLDAFTSGGAQQAGGHHEVDFTASSDLDYVRGHHAFRAGVLIEGGRYRSDARANYLGTYTFASLADFEAGRPSNFTERLGDPAVRYTNLQTGVYGEDNWRVSKSVMFSAGLRFEAQTIVPHGSGFSPRLSLTWAPFAGGGTVLRAGWGRFTDWLDTATYEQTLVVDGTRQQEINIVDPAYPEPGASGSVLTPNRYAIDPGLALPASQAVTAGVQQTIARSWRMSAALTVRRGAHLLRGRNLNTPIGGVRPDPRFGNVVDVTGDAGMRSTTLSVGTTFIVPDRRRLLLAASYALTSSETDTTGPLSLSANGDTLSTEWGPSLPRHRFAALFSLQPLGGLSVNLTARAQSGTPYTITTGQDGNGDGVFNDRPSGVARNSARTAPQWDLGLRVSYAIGFGPPASQAGGQRVTVMMGGGGVQGGFSGGGERRYRIEFYAAADNVTDHHNLIGYSGVETSPFFGQPTSVLNPRRIELGVRFAF